MKTYHIEYWFTGGQHHLQTNRIDEFASFLDQAICNPHTLLHTIKIYTEEKDANR